MRVPSKPRARVTLLVGAVALVAVGGLGLVRGRVPRSVDVRTTDASITKLATNILGHSQFAHHPLDTELAGRLLDRYLEALDGTRTLFFASDSDEFSRYRASLAKATLSTGDTTVAYAIFSRYLERLKAQVSYCRDVLRTASFDFSGHDVYSFDRTRLPRPRDLAAATALWREQLRAEYLQEKLQDQGQDHGTQYGMDHGKNPEKDRAADKGKEQTPSQIVAKLTRRREQQLRTMQGLRDDEVLEIYLDALAHVYDPHSDYLGHEQLQSFSISMNLSLFGIGAALESEDGYCKIRELLPGGPAARSGQLKPGDRIVAVAQAKEEPVDIMNMPLSRAVELIRGPKGSRVTLTILPGGLPDGSAEKKVTLQRDEIKLEDQAARARLIELPKGGGSPLRLGIIELPSFYANMGDGRGGPRRSATADVARLLAKLKSQRVSGVILDVRRNGGGSLAEAVSMTGLFIRQGPVVQTRDAGGKIDVGSDDDGEIAYDGPLVVLASRMSASATEILAGALQDYQRALVVGDSSTFGKGTVQSLLELAPLMDRAGLAHAYDPGALKITISKFYRPSGASTQLRGVASDIVLPSSTDFSDISEGTLKDPLPWDTVPAKPHDRLDRVQPYVEALRARSAARVKGSQGFSLLAADIDGLARSLKSKSVSLNEAERRRELAETQRRQALERQLLAGGEAGGENRSTSYAITLENVDRPGLPPPSAPGTAGGPRAGRPAGTPGAATSVPDDGDGPVAGGGTTDLVLRESLHILEEYVAELAAADARKTAAP